MSISYKFRNLLNEVWSKIERSTGTEFDFNPLLEGVVIDDEPVTIYVSPNGNDSNPGTASLPVKTLAGAEARIGTKKLSNLVTIQLDAGSYKAHIFSGYSIDPKPDGALCGILIRGSYAKATLGQGLNSGTVTSSTTGSSSTHSYSTITDVSQNWNTNALKGLFVRINSGSAATGQFFPILSNTATQLTLPVTTWSAPVGGDGYEIVDITSVIDSPCLIEGLLALDGRVQGAASSTGLTFVNIDGINTKVGVRCEYLKFNIPSAGGITVIGGTADINVSRCSFNGTTAITHSGPAPLTLTSAVIQMTTSGTGLILGSLTKGGAPATVGNTLITSMSGGGGTAISLVDRSLSIGTTYISDPSFTTNGFNTGILLSAGTKLTVTGGVTILNCTSRGVRIEDANDGSTGCSIVGVSGSLEVGSVVIGSNLTAFSISGLQVIVVSGRVLGSGSAIAISISRGARFNLNANSTITGATEISLDGTANTIATMRAASPKLLKSDYGTIIYE
jgi:hypothetical protein